MGKIAYLKSQKVKTAFLVFFFALFNLGLNLNVFGQAVLTQDSQTGFLKGYSSNMIVVEDSVQMSLKGTGLNSWAQTENLPIELYDHEAVQWNNKVFVTGGVQVIGYHQGVEIQKYSSSVYSADVDNGISNWSELNALPDSISSHATIIANGFLYVIGGIGSDSIVSSNIYYAKIRADGTIRDWQTSSNSLPQGLWGHTATFVNGYVVVAGGSNIDDTTAISDVYRAQLNPDGSFGAFTSLASLPQNLNQHSAVVHGNRLYIIGGFDETQSISDAVYYTDIAVNGSISSWQTATSLPEGLYASDASLQNGLLTVIGGFNDNEGYSVQYAYSTQLDNSPNLSWNKSVLYFEHIANAQSFMVNGQLYVLGGYDIFNNTREECYYNNLTVSSVSRTGKGTFYGEVFDLGLDRNVDTLYWAGMNLANHGFYYRSATDGGSWGSWTDATSANDIQINSSLRYVQYMFTVDGAPVNNYVALDSAQLRFAATQLAGAINSDITLTLANSPYWVTEDVTVQNNATVTIEAGVAITFSEGVKMEIEQGYIDANGAAGNEITFTSFTGEDGFWNGLYFNSGSNNYASELDYVVIENAGFNETANLNVINSNQPTINTGTIQNGTNRALYCYGGTPTLNNISFLNNEGYVIELESGSGPIINNPVFTGNEMEIINVVPSTMYTDAFWDNYGLEYLLTGDFLVASNSTLTLDKGLMLKFDVDAGLLIGGAYSYQRGALVAQGSADSVITFTALNGEAGGWDGIFYTNYLRTDSENSYLDYCIVEYGKDYNLYSRNGQPSASNSEFRYSTGYGIEVYNGSPTFDNLMVYDNENSGLYGSYISNPTIQNSHFYNNQAVGIVNSGDLNLFDSHVYNNVGGGINISGYFSNMFPQLENVVIEDNGDFGIKAENCDPDFVNVDVLNHPGHGFLMNANVMPEYYDLVLSGNMTNDFRVNGGSINHNITWEVGQYPFIVIGTFNIDGGSRLTLEKGMTLKFDVGTGITIGRYVTSGGELWAEGSPQADSIITFTSLNGEPGGWNGIYFSPYSYNAADTSFFNHVHIENGNDYNLYAYAGKLIVQNTTITNSAGYGVQMYSSAPSFLNVEVYNNASDGIYGSGGNAVTFDSVFVYQNGGIGVSLQGQNQIFNSHFYENQGGGLELNGYYDVKEPQIENVTIENNGDFGINSLNCDPDFIDVDVLNNGGDGFVMNANVIPEYYNMILSGNQTNDIRIDGGDINRDITWETGEYPFIVIGTFLVGGGSRLTLEKGTTLYFSENTGLGVGRYVSNGGEIWAEGANHPDSLVTFTALNGQSGGWNGIDFGPYSNNSADTSLFKYAKIEFANNYNLRSYTSNIIMDSSIVSHAANYGIQLYNASPQITNSQIVSNGSYGIYITGTSQPVLGNVEGNGNDIFFNNEYDIYNATANTIDATYNFFGTTVDSMIQHRIYDMYDNASYGEVLYTPVSDSSTHLLGGFAGFMMKYHNMDSTILDGTMVHMINATDDTVKRMSNGEGLLAFLNIPDGDYDFEAMTYKPWGGVNATDALRVMQHFSSVITLDGIRLSAADVNASSSVNSTDALLIMQRFAQVIDEFDAGDWVFEIPSGNSQTFADNDLMTDFFGLAYGDVNGSYVPSGGSKSKMVTMAQNGEVASILGNVAIPVTIGEKQELGAISLVVEFPSEIIAVNDIELATDQGQLMYSVEGNQIRIAWFGMEAWAVQQFETLFTIHATVLDESKLDEFALQASTESEFADIYADVIDNVMLYYTKIATGFTNIETEETVQFGLNMYPNPASDVATLEINSASAGSITIQTIDMTGKTIEAINEYVGEGTNTIELDVSTLNSGLYLIKVEIRGNGTDSVVLQKILNVQ